MVEHNEAAWQQAWLAAQLHAPKADGDGDNAYVLEMWPYPSGDLHMGHVRNYTIGDVFARFWRLQGRNVLHPMGWDALGLPAENQAIREGVPPQVRTPQNIARMRAQMQRLGLSYDWSREMASYEPDYYRWNQWFFLQMYERGLAYRRKSRVHFCPGCNTVLANEQVGSDGTCWRGHDGVRQQEISEWAFRITAFADELLGALDTMTQWPSRVVEQQRHWLGRSEGATLRFAHEGPPAIDFEVFTTRIDTVFGCSALVLAPEHPGALKVCTDAQRPKVEALARKLAGQDAATRLAGQADKVGVFTGAYARHPFTGDAVPIWVANFVLADYGTGAVMAVPAHDQRDFEFARAEGLPVRQAITGDDAPPGDAAQWPAAFGGDGTLVGNHAFAGLRSAEARSVLCVHAEKLGVGRATVQWRLRDWGFSRQRYWGTPIPIVYCETHGAVAVPESQLPVRLPDDAATALAATGGPPLGKLASFVATTCPTCQGPARREVETMDTFVCSSWYFARFLAPQRTRGPIDVDAARAWLPVNLYVGGPEHAVMHLLYFRFFTRVMHLLGLVPCKEPVKRLLTQGMVNAPAFRCPRHGYLRPDAIGAYVPGGAPPVCPSCQTPLTVAIEKMSKSKYNGVDPVALIDRFGADTARLYVLFAAPPEKDMEWSSQGVEGQYRFVGRLLRLAERVGPAVADAPASSAPLPDNEQPLRRLLHTTLAKVGEEFATRNHFNTAIASLMELTNALYGANWHETPPTHRAFGKEAMLLLAQMLSPMAPHVAESIWQRAGGAGLCAASRWPSVDADATKTHAEMLAVQVGGKLRGQIEVPVTATREDILRQARAEPRVAKHLEGMQIVKEVLVPHRLVNFVVRPA